MLDYCFPDYFLIIFCFYLCAHKNVVFSTRMGCSSSISKQKKRFESSRKFCFAFGREQLGGGHEGDKECVINWSYAFLKFLWHRFTQRAAMVHCSSWSAALNFKAKVYRSHGHKRKVELCGCLLRFGRWVTSTVFKSQQWWLRPMCVRIVPRCFDERTWHRTKRAKCKAIHSRVICTSKRDQVSFQWQRVRETASSAGGKYVVRSFT